MAGRGRARGRGLSFSVESLGFGRGETLPGSILQPPPLFPALDFKPLPLSSGEEYDYLLALKQEFRVGMKESPYYIKPSERKKDIERYSDKYTAGHENGDAWKPDWSLLPEELKETRPVRRKRKIHTAGVKPSISSVSRRVQPSEPTEGGNITETLEKLEKQEGQQEEDPSTEKKKEGEEEEEEGEDEGDYYEDDAEEETDYNINYFDNGEDNDEDDDLEEGPVY